MDRSNTRSARAMRAGRWATMIPSARDQPADCFEHTRLGLAIEVGRRLVEQQQWCVAEEGAGEGYPLALPGR